MKTKNIFKVCIIIFLFSISVIGYAQSSAPVDPGEGPTGSNDPIGGSAPIGSGMIILGLLGGVYATGKTYSLQKQKK